MIQAPPLPRIPVDADERTTLGAFLDQYRAVMIGKVAGLTREQTLERHVPSLTTLLGMIKHLADVERWWFRRVFLGQDIPDLASYTDEHPDADFEIGDDETVESIVALYETEIAHARSITANAESLDQLAEKPTRRGRTSFRWILVHMIEETARHAGHADILRERTDGTTDS